MLDPWNKEKKTQIPITADPMIRIKTVFTLNKPNIR